MGMLVLSENVCVDGGVQDPVGEGGSDRGGWFTQLTQEDYKAWAEVEYDEALAADALLLGRKTDRFFASAGWNTRPGAWADRLRALPRYVVSATLDQTEWIGGTIVRGDVVTAVTRLKEQYDRDIVVYGSTQLARTLIDHRLVDQVRLTIHPYILGGGEHLLDELPTRTSLRRASARAIGVDLVHLVYDIG